MLQREGVWNDLSPKLIEKLEAQINSFGKSVRFKFDISNPDPDPEKRAAGAILYPFSYTLDPVTFQINDKYEDRPDKQKMKKVGMAMNPEVEDGREVVRQFKRVRVSEKEKGVKKFMLDNVEDREMVMYLLIHPKLTGGEFLDKTKRQVITRIDEVAAATSARVERTERAKAMEIAENMSHEEMITFANAMLWEDAEEEVILRNKIEELAETSPVFFNDLVLSKDVEYQSLVKKAINKGVIQYDPAEHKFSYASNKQVIAIVPASSDKNEVILLSELLQAGGTKMEEVYKKLKSMVDNKKQAVA
jgi:hypothetical protein